MAAADEAAAAAAQAAAEAKTNADAAAVAAKAEADAAAAAAATATADAAAAAKAAADAAAAAAATAAADAAAAAKAAADDAAAAAATAAADAAAAAKVAADEAVAAAAADRQAAQDEADRLQGEADTAADAAAVAKAEGLFAAIRTAVEEDTSDFLAFAEEEGVPGITLNAPDADDASVADTDNPRELADMVLMTSQGMDTMVAFGTQFPLQENGTLTVNNVAHGDIAMSARFPETGSVTYGNDLMTTEKIELSGSLMAALGTFHCDEENNGCSVAKTSTGYSFTGPWHFTANDGAMAVLPDDDYTGYGWWAYRTETGFVVDAFTVVSTGASRIAADAEPVGTATYEGGAAGKFAINNRPLGTTLEAGHFTAVATLVADFDFDADGTTAGNSISGTVDEFVANDVERPGWEVSLGETNFTFAGTDNHFELDVPDPTALDPATDNTANLWTIDDVEGVESGNWSGSFYNDGDPRNDGTPEVVTGTFSVSHGSQGEVAHMIGAFQANNSHADTPSTDN